MLSFLNTSIHPSKENLTHRIIVIEDVEPHHQLLFIRRPAEHTEKEDAAVDFFRLHPVKMKGPTDNRS